MTEQLFPPDTSQRYVRVVPEATLDMLLDYALPEDFGVEVQIGQRILVPLGRREVFAYVVEFPEQPESASCRLALRPGDRHTLLTESLVQLAWWISRYYCCPFPTVLRGMLPAVIRATNHGSKEQLWAEIPESVDPDDAERLLKRAKVQWRAWQQVHQNGANWLTHHIKATGIPHATWASLAQKKLLRLEKKEKERVPFKGELAADTAFTLNAEQEAALQAVEEERKSREPRPTLLQGVTGSGKTEVYLRAIEEVLQSGKQALVLVPEIALTPQTVERFRRRFESGGRKLAVLHSHLSAGERHDQWQRIRSGEASIVIGARSAIFAPLTDPGIIVVDEEHENSYKQEEAPRYHARDVAIVRGKLERIPVVLGSATPSLESYQNAVRGRYRWQKLTQRVEKGSLPFVQVIDLRREKPARGGVPLIAEPLRLAVEQRLQRGEQVILFLNRRGYATSVVCEKCGEVSECPHCSIPLTFHKRSHEMRCHLCDYEDDPPDVCASCGFDQSQMRGKGTQRIEDAVSEAFPGSRWQRMDSDSMKSKDAYERVLTAFREGRIDILVGTQMIAKGLHFPKVTCVGVIDCDRSLHLEDFRAAERTFQQLVQVAGRAGRGDQPGDVFVQTLTPFHDAIQFARHHDVDGFLECELEDRRIHGYPPFRRSALITFRGKSEDRTRYCIESAVKALREKLDPDETAPDPGPAPIEKIRDEYRFQCFLLTKDMMKLSSLLRECVTSVKWPEGVRAVVDIDPVDMR
jgi:primosomal protein N' (replication factor Y)